MSSISVNTITDASGGTTTSINGYTPTVSNMAGRNRIINGDMRIDQRNAGAVVTVSSNGEYTLDRWWHQSNPQGKFSIGQSTTAPVGFTLSAVVTSLSAYSIGAGDYQNLVQNIEGYNVADLNWGTSNAKPVTISFWVRSSLTGTFGGSVLNDDQSRAYPFTYTIASANAWEYKTLTISGDTSGTWLTNNGIGMRLSFGLGVGSNYSATAGSWQDGVILSATGATSVVGTSGATFYVTGVQLEAGSVATPFEHRMYGQELALCQRYYYKNIASGSGRLQFDQYVVSGSIFPVLNLMHPVEMRSVPTMTKIGSWIASGLNLATLSFTPTVSLVRLQMDANTTGRGFAYPNTDEGFSASAEL